MKRDFGRTMAWLFGAEDDGIAALGLSEDPPMVAPAGSYQVRVRVVEARDLSAILNFSLYKSSLEPLLEEPGGG